MLKTLTLGWAVLYADRTSLYPLLAIIASTLGLTSAQAGLITSVYFIFYVMMQIPAGLLGDRWGLKQVLMVFYAIAAIGIGGLGLWGNAYIALLIFAALHGLGAGSYYPCAYGTVLHETPVGRRGFSSAIIGVGMALGLLGGLAASGPLYQRLGSYGEIFLLMSAPTFLMVFLFWRQVPPVQPTGMPSWREYREILLDRELILINIATFASLYGFWALATWGPTYLMTERGFGLGQAGLFTGLIACSAVPAGILWGKLSDKLGRKRMALFVIPAGGLSLYLVSACQDWTLTLIALLFFGAFSNSAVMPVMVAWTGDIVTQKYPGRMGAAIGIFNSVIMSAAIFAPAVTGYVRDVTGALAPALLGAALIMVLGTAVLFPVRENSSFWQEDTL